MHLNDHASREHAKYFSASSSERWMACPGSARLSAAYPRQDTPFTLEGTKAHEIAEACALNAVLGRKVEIEEGGDVTPEMIKHGQSYADYIAGLCGPDTTVMLEQRVDFSSWVPEGFGTADCILLSGDTMDVIDYKYGAGVAVSAVKNPQMQLYGLGAVSEYGFVYEVSKVRLHIFQPRKDNVSVYEMTVEELEAFGAKAAAAAEEAMADDPRLLAGDHCKFCPHGGKCPELARHCINCASSSDTIAPDPKTINSDCIALILRAEPMISAWLKKIKETALAEMLNGESIPGYKVVEGKLGNRAWTDEIKVANTLAAAGIPKEDYTTLQLLSPAAMDKALGKKRAAELLEGLITRAAGSPTIVPESDKRPKMDRVAQAAEDFAS